MCCSLGLHFSKAEMLLPVLLWTKGKIHPYISKKGNGVSTLTISAIIETKFHKKNYIILANLVTIQITYH